MKVGELMTPDVEIVRPDDTLHTAARMMADLDTGALPVGENDKLVGMITDRDITIRAVAEGRDPDQTKVRDAMSEHIRFCFEDEDTQEVSRKMSDWAVRRLPVLNRDKRLVGIVSLGDLATGGAEEESRKALEEISDAPPGSAVYGHLIRWPSLAGRPASRGRGGQPRLRRAMGRKRSGFRTTFRLAPEPALR